MCCSTKWRTTTMISLFLLGVGCRRPPETAVVPASISEGYCWNTVYRTDLVPDTVAFHFQRAFGALGLTNTTWSARGDTAWSHGGPTRIDGDRGGATYEARVVAYRTGDSTHFRHFVSVTPPPEGWPLGADSSALNGHRYALGPSTRLIGFCGEVGRAAQVHGTAAREPDPEASLEVWKRAPY